MPTLLLVLAGCSSTAPSQTSDASPQDSLAADVDVGPPWIDTKVGTETFTSIANAWRAGSDGKNNVVLLFSNSASCDLVSSTGWSTGLAAGTQIVRVHVPAQTLGTFKVAHPPGPGEASLYWSKSRTDAPTPWIAAATGAVTITRFEDGGVTEGSFSGTNGPGMVLKGRFAAAYCAKGVEE